MSEADRRRFQRKDSHNLIHYTVMGKGGETLTRNMGRTLDVSEEGLLLETHIPLQKGQSIMLTVALEEEMVDLKGQVVHMKPSSALTEKSYHSGVEFRDMRDEEKAILKKYISAIKYEQE